MKTNNKLSSEYYYSCLCACSDSLLAQRKNSVVCSAISSLHIIREHPIFLSKYLFQLKRGFLVQLEKLFFLLLEWSQIVLFSLFLSNKNFFRFSNDNKDLDFLFISHLVNSNFSYEKKDFYFDKMPYLLQNDGFNSGIALVNHTKLNNPSIIKEEANNKLRIFLFAKYLSLKSELSFLLKIIKEVFQLLKIKQKIKGSFCKDVLTSAIYDSFSRNTVHSLRLYEQIKLLVSEFKPKVIVITFEGHAWERLAFAAARESNPEIVCVGYQHAVIFRLQHAIRRSLESPVFNPDVIVCSGLVGKNQLEASTSLKSIPKYVIGSNRSINKSDVLSKEEFQTVSNKEVKVCLVLPEGDLIECNLLFEFSLECAKRFPEINFVWRLHPLITFKELFKKNNKLTSLPDNIVLSNDTLINDISKCNLALYRGTTAIIQAVGSGLKPIYFSLPNEMTIDPLYEINNSLNYVYQVEDFFREVNYSFTWNQYLKLRNYCNKMFSPLNHKILEQNIFDHISLLK